MIIALIIILLYIVLPFAGLAGIFNKAGVSYWKALIPVYNIIVLLKIIKRPVWDIVFVFLPVISFVFIPYVFILLFQQFGIKKFHKVLFGIMFFYLSLPLLGFSKKYKFNPDNVKPLTLANESSVIISAGIISLIFMFFIKISNIFFYQYYKVPVGSMEETLFRGDHICVSKTAAGIRLPITPLALPFENNRIPFLGIKSYISSINFPYIRLGNLNIVQNQLVTFNFPAGDTVIAGHSEQSYWANVRGYAQVIQSHYPVRDSAQVNYEYLARKYIRDNFDISSRPVDRRDVYVKRCVALPGDTFQIIHGKVYVNGVGEENNVTLQYNYDIFTDGTRINPKTLEKMEISSYDRRIESNGRYTLALTQEKAEKLKSFTNVLKVNKIEDIPGRYANQIFPHNPGYPWNPDNFGPVVIPEKGATVDINVQNICLYQRIINAYEGNHLEVKDSIIYINFEPVSSYTFKMDYYFMMGDNRHNSYDSRFWGFVPEDHVFGVLSYVLVSVDNDKKRIRKERIFKTIH